MDLAARRSQRPCSLFVLWSRVDTRFPLGSANNMRDDGINYFKDLCIVPPEDIERVAAELAAVAACQNWNNGDAEDLSFGWQGG